MKKNFKIILSLVLLVSILSVSTSAFAATQTLEQITQKDVDAKMTEYSVLTVGAQSNGDGEVSSEDGYLTVDVEFHSGKNANGTYKDGIKLVDWTATKDVEYVFVKRSDGIGFLFDVREAVDYKLPYSDKNIKTIEGWKELPKLITPKLQGENFQAPIKEWVVSTNTALGLMACAAPAICQVKFYYKKPVETAPPTPELTTPVDQTTPEITTPVAGETPDATPTPVDEATPTPTTTGELPKTGESSPTPLIIAGIVIVLGGAAAFIILNKKKVNDVA